MSRTSLLAVAAVLAAASLSAAGISVSTRFFKITVDAGRQRKVEYARATRGRLALSERGGWSDWEDREESRPDRWYVLGMKIKSSTGAATWPTTPPARTGACSCRRRRARAPTG
jgi:hypothetical protein